ncbi:CheY-like chemotaxis protein [Bradyrhizobium sp. JR3.5]
MARDVRVTFIGKHLVAKDQAKAVDRIKKTPGMALDIWRSFQRDRHGPAKHLESRFNLSIPAVDDEPINISRIQAVLRQSKHDCIEIVDGLIAWIVAALLLLGAKDKPPVLDDGNRPVMCQLDAANAHTTPWPNGRNLIVLMSDSNSGTRRASSLR